jgi:hypothetical protein
MSNRLSITMGVVLAMVFFFAGCEPSHVSGESSPAVGLNPDRISAPSGFTAEAVKAAGGLEAWTQTQMLGFDCVVTFYEPDGSFYLTRQHYNVYPWMNTIEISGRESKGDYTWQLSNGELNVLRDAGQVEEFPASLERPSFAEAILAITMAPVSLLNPSDRFNRQDAAVKKEGKWYYPIHKTGELSGEAVFYQDRDTLLVDMIRVPCSGADKALAVRGYDYQQIEQGPFVPARIEIFTIDLAGVIKNRLVKIDCHSVIQAK